MGGPVSGSAAFNKAGAGTIILGGTNTYTGSTTVYAGALLVNGNSLATTNIWTVVGGAALGGTGKIGGMVNYQNGSLALFTITPTNTPYQNSTYLAFTNAVFMTNVTVKVSMPAALGNGVYVLATNYVGCTTNGSLTFATNSGALGSGAAGNVSLAGNNFILTVSGGAPTGVGTYYVSNTVLADMNFLGATSSQPFAINGPGDFSGISVSGTALTLTVTNGTPNGAWTLLQGTNLALPLSQWTTNLTGIYDSGGNFITNLPTTITNPAIYFILK